VLLEAVEHGHTGNVPIVRRRVLGLCTAVNLQGAGMTDGWEPPSEAECQACWDGLKAKLAAAEKSKAEWMIEWEGMNAAATDMLINSTHEVVVKERKRIAELETERAALLAEVKRLTDILGTKTFIRSDQIKPSGDAKRDPISPRDPLERA